MRIVHVSDLHVDCSDFIPEWGERLVRMVNAEQADLLIITGDLVDSGFDHEYEVCGRYLERFEAAATIVTPGNHDVRNNGGLIYDELFASRSTQHETDRVVVAGVDSTQADLDQGFVGQFQYGWIREQFAGRDAKTKILALHHHMLPIPGAGKEGDIVRDAGELLRLCVDVGVDIVLAGHMHRPWTWKLENTYFITAGTPTTRRMKARTPPSFYRIELGDRPTLTELDVRDASSHSMLLELAHGDRVLER